MRATMNWSPAGGCGSSPSTSPYGYEEFVEGLRPESGGDGAGLRLKVRDGVLKRIAERARSARTEPVEKRQFFKAILDVGDMFEECVRDECVRFAYNCDWCREDWSDPKFDAANAFKRYLAQRPGAAIRNHAEISSCTFRCKPKRGDIVVVSRGWTLSEYRAVGEIVGDYEFAPKSPYWPHRRAVRWLWLAAEADSRPVDDFQDRQLISHRFHRLRPDRPEVLLRHLGQDTDRPPHVLVIDEINRANIAKVLGELITLLEEDKREGAENEIAVTLAHSGQLFTLPGNLHLLETMNTADRSIALLDTALRRRFTFEEMTPDPALLKEAEDSAGVDLPEVLQAMNYRLEWLLGRDHLVGHAWFLGAKSRQDIDEVMRRKVIPLIAEYFYDDWEKVRAVLGGTDAFVQGKELDSPPGLDGAGETRRRWTVRSAFEEGAYQELIGVGGGEEA